MAAEMKFAIDGLKEAMARAGRDGLYEGRELRAIREHSRIAPALVVMYTTPDYRRAAGYAC